MPKEDEPTVTEIREVILAFLEEKRDDKLKSTNSEEKKEKIIQDFKPENWIADAAERVKQLQQVTHGAKYIHPDIKPDRGIAVPDSHEGPEDNVGTHTVMDRIILDVAGNAAALDVYKFLKLEVKEKTLLDLVMERSENLLSAFSSGRDEAEQWAEKFRQLPDIKDPFASHTYAKQIYWPLGGGQYHLLSPLFPTSLTHLIWTRVREDRWSEDAREAREKKKKNEPHSSGFHEYPGLIIQKFGGSKKQNISQMNSERSGENYLLPSLPPTWVSDRIRPPYRCDSIFAGPFGRKQRVRRLADTLRRFLHRTGDWNNRDIRQKREELTRLIIDELLQYAYLLRNLEPGWSTKPECRLNTAEACWLDPHPTEPPEGETEFTRLRQSGEWKQEVTSRFAKWMNDRLRANPGQLPVGDTEAALWRRELEKEMDTFKEELE